MTDPHTMTPAPERSKLATLFKAGQGAAPPKLAGREAELVKPASFLAGLLNNEPPPRDIVLFGPRGNGMLKTSFFTALMPVFARSS